MKKRINMYVTLFIGLMLITSLIASFANTQHEDNNVITAAYNRVTGALRIVEDGEIRNNESLISWNKTGPTGPQGPAGDTYSYEEIQALVKELVEIELDELINLNNALEARILVLEQELGLVEKDIVLERVFSQYINIKHNSSVDDLIDSLPGSVKVLLDDGTYEYFNVDWSLEDNSFDTSRTGMYILYGQLLLEDGFCNPDNLQAKLYLTVPANIWVNVVRYWDSEIANFISSYEVTVYDLQANEEYSIDVLCGEYVDGRASGITIYSWTVSSDDEGKISHELPSFLNLTSSEMIVISQSLSGMYGTHGVLPYCPIETVGISESDFMGSIIFPKGWNEDDYVGNIIVNDSEYNSGYEFATLPMYYSHLRKYHWHGTHENEIWNSMTGIFEINHENGGGVRFSWSIPECEWAGDTVNRLSGIDKESNVIELDLVGEIETSLTRYEWAGPYYPYGYLSGSAYAELEVKKDDEYYDTYVMKAYYGDGLMSNSLQGNLYKEEKNIGSFTLAKEFYGSSQWRGEAFIDYEGDVTIFEWHGFLK